MGICFNSFVCTKSFALIYFFPKQNLLKSMTHLSKSKVPNNILFFLSKVWQTIDKNLFHFYKQSKKNCKIFYNVKYKA